MPGSRASATDSPVVPDETLVKATLDGDQSAFGELYRRYVGRVTRYMAKRVWDRAARDDAVQETFIQAFARLDTFDPDRGPFDQFLFGAIARYVVLNLGYEAQKERRLVDRLCLYARLAPTTPAGPADSEMSPETAALLEKLSDRERRVVELHYLDGRSYDDIAEELGRDWRAVKVMSSRAVRRMRDGKTRARRSPARAGHSPGTGGISWHKRDCQWVAEVWTPAADGSMRRRSRYATTREEAEAAFQALRAEALAAASTASEPVGVAA